MNNREELYSILRHREENLYIINLGQVIINELAYEESHYMIGGSFALHHALIALNLSHKYNIQPEDIDVYYNGSKPELANQQVQYINCASVFNQNEITIRHASILIHMQRRRSLIS